MSIPTQPLDAAPTAPVQRPKPATKAVPERSPEFAAFDLAALREHRAQLNATEAKVSYWRRILQARLDVLRAGLPDRTDADYLRPVLAEAREGLGRRAIVHVLPGDEAPVPDLVELWDRTVDHDDPAAVAAFDTELAQAESQLSAYRGALHKRIAAVTGELIARYREDPTLCLVALPLAPKRSARATAC